MISKVFRVTVCLSSFVYTFYILCNFMFFLSRHNDNQNDISRKEPAENIILSTLWILIINASLLSMFILQHSVMASDFLKDIYYKLKLEDMERSVFNCCCAAVLHFLMINWQTTTWYSLWNIDTTRNDKLWLFMTATHVLAWFIIYCGCLMMDISELAGIKQVYYKISSRPRPMAMKSRELQRYMGHMRHPSFTSFLIILWVHPVMSIDRLVMATLLTIYMIMMWSIDLQDFSYHSIIIKRKQRELTERE